MISVDNLTKSFGNRILFDDISFRINKREHVGLVGRNGHGKTTLFKIITGNDVYDAGSISIPKNYRIGYVTQEIDFTEKTVLDESMKGLPEAMSLHHWESEKILTGLGFSNADIQKSPNELSGGYQVRLNLAKVLLSLPDLLLLDEPTNYLDIASIRWIKKYLQNWPREIFLITHDRGFMDSVVSHIIGIYRHKTRKVSGNTEKYYLQIAQEEEIYEKTRINEERRRKEIEEFIARFRAKARLAGLVQSRIKTLNKQENRQKREKFRNLDFSFRYKWFNGKFIGTIKDLEFQYTSEKKLISGFDLVIGAKDRICIVGKNGAGKTTLLKLLAGVLKPAAGEIIYHPEAVMGYYEQTNTMSLQEARTVEEEILFSSPDIDRQTARNICGTMLFEGDSALKKIGVLSGGEKSRVMIGKLLCTSINLLVLDEPSNHFDIESCDALLSAIDQFDGAVIMVTHNEMFLNALAERLIVFKNDELLVFEGDYQSFLSKIGWEDSDEARNENHESDNLNQEKLNKKEIRRLRSNIISERSGILKPLEARAIELEDIIDLQDKLLNNLNQEMQKASEQKDGKKIVEISKKISQCQAEINIFFEELENLTLQIEEKQLIFDKRLKALDAMETNQ